MSESSGKIVFIALGLLSEVVSIKNVMSKKAFKVLIVEDDTALLKVLTVAIEKAGYDVVSCTNPAEALSDGPNMVRSDALEALLKDVLAIDKIVRK